MTLRALLPALALMVFVCVPASAAQFKIMIITWRGCEEACLGFQKYLVEQGVDAEFILRDAGRKNEALGGFLLQAREHVVDLILTWGTSVTKGVVGTLSDSDDKTIEDKIPVLFTIVSDPVGSGIVKSLDRTGRSNVTGTYNRVPEAVNIETVRAYLPKFKSLGMLYHTNEKNSALKRDEVAALTETMAFNLVSLELPLGNDGSPRVEDIAPKIAELKAAGVDFLYLGSSSFLRAHKEIVTGAALENGIPVLSPYEDLVRDSKALLSVAPKYYDVGRLAGSLAEKILVEGVSPGDLPVARMTQFAIVINMDVAKRLKLFPPLSLLQIAEIVD